MDRAKEEMVEDPKQEEMVVHFLRTIKLSKIGALKICLPR